MLIKIYNFFGFKTQLEKAWEEFEEVEDALCIYTLDESTANIVHLLEEISDLTNVISGIAKTRHGVNLEQIDSVREGKQVRTCKIIDKIVKFEKENGKLSPEGRIRKYEELRR